MKANPYFLVLAGAALALLGPSPHAQQQAFKRVTKSLKAHTLDLGTGTLTRGMSTTNRAAGSAIFVSSDFFNLDLGGFIGADTGSGFCEWFDAGCKGFTNNHSDLMSSVVFAYCSSMFSVASGGPGSSFKLGYYEGSVTGGGTASTNVFSITLTGMPGNTGSSSFFGGCTPHAIRLFVGGLIPFADGPIGYSWKFLDNGTGTLNPVGATISGTFPWMSCVNSCSSTSRFQMDPQCMDDQLDEYCPPGFLRSTFTFGTAQSSTSLNMSIEELDDITLATIVNSNSGTQPNPDILTADRAILARPWTATLTLGIARTKANSWVLYFGSTNFLPNGVQVAQFTSGFNFGASKAGRMLLCNINTGGLSVNTVHSAGAAAAGTSSTSAAANIPINFALVCNNWCAQAVVLGKVAVDPAGLPSARMSSMTGGILGTH